MRGQGEAANTSHWPQNLCHREFPPFGVRGGVNHQMSPKIKDCPHDLCYDLCCPHDLCTKAFPEFGWGVGPKSNSIIQKVIQKKISVIFCVIKRFYLNLWFETNEPLYRFRFMRNFVQVFLSLIVTVCISTSCVKLHEDADNHYKIYFENKWNKSIVINYHIDWHWYDNPFEAYSDSLFFEEKPISESWRHYEIKPGGIDSKLMEHNDYYEIALEKQDSVVIYVFDAEQPDKKDSECFLVRYHLSKEDLQKVKFRISFPPTDAMKDFYMKPSYEELNEYLMR